MTAYDDLLLRHVDGSLYTGNARPTQDAILNAALVADPRPVGVVLEASAVHRVTLPLIDTLEALQTDLAAEDIGLAVAGLPGDVLETARKSRWFAKAEGEGLVAPTVDEAIRRVRGR